MLVNLVDTLKHADENNYAVGAFNVVNLDMIRGILLAAEEENSPVIISLAEAHLSFTPLKVLGPILIALAKSASVPVVVHLDHGTDINVIMSAIHMGFTSVMFDGSSLPIEENINLTHKVVQAASEFNVSVEGEVGKLVTPETGSTEKIEELHAEDFYTNAMQAQEFVEKTGVDALAIAFGTAHGLYKMEPKLDFERVQTIKDIVGIPLVMHGGSGLSDIQYKQSIAHGITKINYYSDMANTVTEKINSQLSKKGPHYIHDISQWTIQFVAENIIEKLRIFGSSHKAVSDFKN